jgi:hypothetical protein
MQAACSQSGHDAIQWISPAIALLAVIFGPVITWKLTSRQISESRAIEDRRRADSRLDDEQRRHDERQFANKQIVAPMRQAWINKLRENIATLLQAAFQVAYGPGPSPDVPNFVRVVETMAQIELSLNLNEEDHRALLDLLSKLVTKCVDNPGSPNPSHWVAFWQEQRAIRKAAAAVLKREWDRVKTDDAN